MTAVDGSQAARWLVAVGKFDEKRRTRQKVRKKGSRAERRLSFWSPERLEGAKKKKKKKKQKKPPAGGVVHRNRREKTGAISKLHGGNAPRDNRKGEAKLG